MIASIPDVGAIDQLVQISSPSLIDSALPDGIPALAPFGARGAELYELLTRRTCHSTFGPKDPNKCVGALVLNVPIDDASGGR
jgi:hypothetical protein